MKISLSIPMYKLTYASFFVLSIFLFTSFTLSSLFHILLLPPSLYFFYKSFSSSSRIYLSKSSYMLLGLVCVSALSILFNDHPRPIKTFLNLKYYLIAILSIFSLQKCYDSNYFSKEKIRLISHLFLFFSGLASLYGILALFVENIPVVCDFTIRNCGLYSHTMTYSYGIQMVLLVMIALVIKNKDLSLNPFLLYISLAITTVGFYLGYARGAYLGFFAGFFILFSKGSLKKIFMATLSLLILIVSIFFFSPEWQKILVTNYKEGSNQERISLAKMALKTFLKNPFLGVGFKNFWRQHSQEMKDKYNLHAIERHSAHNNFLEHLASTGFLGFLFLLLFHIFWFHEVWIRKDSIAFIVLPVIPALFVSGQFQYNFGDGENVFFLMTLYSLSQIKLRETQQL